MKIAAFIALAGAMFAAPALADTTVIHAGALVIDAESQPRGPSTITVTDGKIVSVADGFTAAPAQAVTVDLKDKTVVPGMVDLHVHLTGDPGGDFWKGGSALIFSSIRMHHWVVWSAALNLSPVLCPLAALVLQ